jgi:hypothetical protein
VRDEGRGTRDEGIRERLRLRVARLRRETPVIPGKALLTRDGGVCPDDGATLRFDPWSPREHRCPRCGSAWSGPRHDGHWARAQHLWLAERTADLATLAALDGDRAAAERAWDLYAACEEHYFTLPNRDNVLGPSHLFFSTYLESIWLTHWLAGAHLLREADLLPEDRIEGVNRVADEAATIIGEFNEGHSNRQCWNAAALIAIGVWFEDDELVQSTVEARSGLVGHLTEAIGDDGLWWEGENYHIFALRGLMLAMQWARIPGFDVLEDDELRRRFRLALLGPRRTALPDLTYPARKDARYGVSLAQPAFLELVEIGRAWLGEDEELDRWLGALRGVAPPAAEHYDAWLHETGLDNPPADPRHRLSYWAYLTLGPDTSVAALPWQGESAFLASQGLAVLRHGDRYASLECGRAGGGHGHPDALHLTLHAGGVHWLPDPGTGSYVDPSLFWYRSPLAHNVPLLDREPPPGPVRCDAFDTDGDWTWVRGRKGEVSRTVVAGPAHVIDLVEAELTAPGACESIWHFEGDLEMATPGTWQAAGDMERFTADAGQVTLTVKSGDGKRLGVVLTGHAELRRGQGPGLPGTGSARPFLVQWSPGPGARFVAVLTTSTAPEDGVRSVAVERGVVTVETASGPLAVRLGAGGAQVAHGTTRASLGGILPPPVTPSRILGDRPTWDIRVTAPLLADPPALDGSLEGFVLDDPIELAGEEHYLRSEEPYDPEQFSARAWVNRDPEALYLAVEVDKPELLFRPPDAPPLALDNEPDDINSDGIQFYLRFPEEEPVGFLVVPEPGGGLRVAAAGGTRADPAAVAGAWQETETGYRVTLGFRDERFLTLDTTRRAGFELVVNEMRPGRERRAGQLAWAGGGGWVYLRGDRVDPGRLGALALGA